MIQLEEIFKQFENSSFKQLVRRGYGYSTDIKPASVLIVGLNPSYADDGHKIIPFSIHDNNTRPDNAHPYFKAIHDLIQMTGLALDQFAYTDIFYFRETNQKAISKNIQDPKWVEFISAQLAFTEWKIRTLIKPRLIVTINSEANTYLGIRASRNKQDFGKGHNIWIGYHTSWSEDFGCLKVCNIHSDILSIGQQTMSQDTYLLPSTYLKYQPKESKKRLSWHIKFILDR